eukprot:676718-Pyramimonas_sp.AAC.1
MRFCLVARPWRLPQDKSTPRCAICLAHCVVMPRFSKALTTARASAIEEHEIELLLASSTF